MRDSREFETPRSPWAFFLPVLLAVLIGQLAANWLSVRLWPAAPVETAAAVVSEAPAQAPVVDPAPLPTPVAAVPPADPVAVLPAPDDPEVTPAPAERARPRAPAQLRRAARAHPADPARGTIAADRAS